MSQDLRSMIWDYLVFIIFIIGSTAVAVYSRFSGPKEKTKADYVFTSSKVSMAAMMLSIARGTLGVRSFLGYPSELFYRGSGMWETLYGMVLAYPIVCFVFVPVYFSLGITSVYQYLDLRFKSRLVRCLASGTYIVRQLLNQGVTVFTPCVALNTVIGIPYWASIFGISFVSVLFNIMGGLKAAIWADVMQGVTMIALSVAIILQGCIEAGGFGHVYEVNKDQGRLTFMNFDMDLTVRATTTSALVGQLFMSLSIFGCQQNFVQRYCSMESQKKVTKTLMYNIPVITTLFSLSWIAGMVIFAVYANCDPLTSGYIKKYDEILPFFVEDRFHYLPGLLGLFMASLFNGALSLNVSNLNSLATVTWEDFLRPVPGLRDLKDHQQLYVIKFIGVVYGFVIMGISFGVGLLSGVIESSMLVTSATSGPLLGVFLLAMLVPCCNWKGAATGVIIGHIVTLWITIGGLTVDKPPIQTLPLSVAGCTNDSFNDHIVKPDLLHWRSVPKAINYYDINKNETNFSVPYDIIVNNSFTMPTDPLSQLYSITYMYYAFIGCTITVVLGIATSLLTGTDERDLFDEKLIHPMALRISNWFPGTKRRYTGKQSAPSDGSSTRNGLEKSCSVSTISMKSSSSPPSCDVQIENIRTRL